LCVVITCFLIRLDDMYIYAREKCVVMRILPMKLTTIIMPTGCTRGAPTYQAVRQYPPFVVLSQFQQSFVDIHLRYYLLTVFTEYSLQ